PIRPAHQSARLARPPDPPSRHPLSRTMRRPRPRQVPRALLRPDPITHLDGLFRVRHPRCRRLVLESLEDRAAPDTLRDLLLAGATGGPVAALTLAIGALPAAVTRPPAADAGPSPQAATPAGGPPATSSVPAAPAEPLDQRASEPESEVSSDPRTGEDLWW